MQHDPENGATWLARGVCRKEVGNVDGGLSDLDRAVELTTGRQKASALLHRGGVQALRGRFKAAIADYTEALALDPELWAAHVSRGNARYHRRDPHALADYRSAFQLNAAGTVHELVRTMEEAARQAPDDVLANCDKHLRAIPMT